MRKIKMPKEFEAYLNKSYVSNRLTHVKAHVSEVIQCTAKSFLRRIMPVDNPEAKQIWMAGLGWEREILGAFAKQRTYGSYCFGRKEVIEEKSGLMPSVVATLDGEGEFDRLGKCGIEVKFTRYNMPEPSNSYLDQVMMYGKMSGQRMILIVRSLVPNFRTDFYVSTPEDERPDEYYIDMERRAVEMLQKIRDFMFEVNFNGLNITDVKDYFKYTPEPKPINDWECAYCEYSPSCPYAWELADLWWTSEEDVLKTRWKKRLIETVLNGKIVDGTMENKETPKDEIVQ